MSGLQYAMSSANMRLTLRIYFTIFLLLLGYVGRECCDKRVKLRILRRQNFSLVDMTGWLSGFDASLAGWSLRASPAGWLGYIMVCASLMWIGSDLAVSGLVVTVNVVSRCPFNSSGVYAVTIQNWTPDFIIEPGPFGSLYQTINQARLTSLNNGGLGGIYSKVNGDPSFRADSFDKIGQWKCQDSEVVRSYPSNTSVPDISEDLLAQNLLFPALEDCSYRQTDNINSSIVILSMSPTQGQGGASAPWDIRAAIDISPNVYSTQYFRTYLCHMDAPSIENIVTHTGISNWGLSWCQELRGHLYSSVGSASTLTTDPGAVLESGWDKNLGLATTVSTDPGAVLESVLDNLIMLAGSSQNLAQFPILDPTQGCLDPRTEVSWVVISLFILVTVATGAMALYWIALSILIHRAAKRQSPQRLKAIEDYTPNGLLSWMMQAVRETSIQELSVKDLKEWSFGSYSDGQHIGLIRNQRVDKDMREHIVG